ncbi:MAG: hypothetical protein ACM30I_10875 [Gemmatimonas sp.]
MSVTAVPNKSSPKSSIRVDRGALSRARTILVAGPPECVLTVTRTLAGKGTSFQIATTLKDAERNLVPGLTLILCGLHFDRGRIFEFLRKAKASPYTATVPFVCVRAVGLLNKQLSSRGIEVASRELGAAAYVDYAHLAHTLGEDAAAKHLRDIVSTLCE